MSETTNLDAIRETWEREHDRQQKGLVVRPALRDMSPKVILHLLDTIDELQQRLEDAPPPADAGLLALANRTLGDELNKAKNENTWLKQRIHEEKTKVTTLEGLNDDLLRRLDGWDEERLRLVTEKAEAVSESKRLRRHLAEHAKTIAVLERAIALALDAYGANPDLASHFIRMAEVQLGARPLLVDQEAR